MATDKVDIAETNNISASQMMEFFRLATRPESHVNRSTFQAYLERRDPFSEIVSSRVLVRESVDDKRQERRLLWETLERIVNRSRKILEGELRLKESEYDAESRTEGHISFQQKQPGFLGGWKDLITLPNTHEIVHSNKVQIYVVDERVASIVKEELSAFAEKVGIKELQIQQIY